MTLNNLDSGSAIYFYYPTGPYGWLSTFSDDQIFIDEELWPTVEHYFQANKFDSVILRTVIRLASTPLKAKKLAKLWKKMRRSNWDNIKENIMYKALNAKFSQHHNLRIKLIETDDFQLIEDSKEDYYWGIGANGKGKNRLGYLLMNLRADILKMSRTHENKFDIG